MESPPLGAGSSRCPWGREWREDCPWEVGSLFWEAANLALEEAREHG